MAFNTQLILVFFIFFVFIVLSVVSTQEHDVGFAFGFAIATLLPIAVFLLSPLYFVFSEDEVVIIYTLGQKEPIKWNEIRSISQRGSWMVTGWGPPYYRLTYPTNKKRAFFVRGMIPKTRKTKKLIQKYYKKDII